MPFPFDNADPSQASDVCVCAVCVLMNHGRRQRQRPRPRPRQQRSMRDYTGPRYTCITRGLSQRRRIVPPLLRPSAESTTVARNRAVSKSTVMHARHGLLTSSCSKKQLRGDAIWTKVPRLPLRHGALRTVPHPFRYHKPQMADTWCLVERDREARRGEARHRASG
jgi:hypothetical protein